MHDGSDVRVDRSAFRKTGNYALARGSEAARPALRAIARRMSRGAPTNPATWRRGLIIGSNHVGDILHRTCSLSQLRSALPDCVWDYLTSRSSAEVLEGNATISSVFPFASDSHSWPLTRTAISTLRSANYDVVLCTSTTRHAFDLALAITLGAPNRVAFGDKGYSGLATTTVPLKYPRPAAEYFRAMVGHVTGAAPVWRLQPQVFPGALNQKAASEYWAALNLPQVRPVIACTVTTRQALGAWPLDFFIRTLRAAVASRPVSILLFGGGGDAPSLRHVAESLPSVVDVSAGKLGWLDFACVLRRCDALLAMDSGPRHMANAVGTPVAFVRNLATSRIEAGAYCENEVDLAPLASEYLAPRQAADVASRMSAESCAARLLALADRRDRSPQTA